MNARDESHDELLDAVRLDQVEPDAVSDVVIDVDDSTALLPAVRQLARAHGIAEAERRVELGEKTLFRALSGNGNVHKLPLRCWVAARRQACHVA